MFVNTRLLDATDDANDCKDGDDQFEDANHVDCLLEGEPKEGVDDTHGDGASANLTLINVLWIPLKDFRCYLLLLY